MAKQNASSKGGQSRMRAQTRAERQAQQAAAESARMEQIAKDRRQQTILGVIVVVVIVALIAVAATIIGTQIATRNQRLAQNQQQALQAVQQVKDKPAKATENGGFLISKDGYNKPIAGAPTVAIFMDPICPGCGALNRLADPALISMMHAGQINLEIHPLSFMDQLSTDEYSTRTSNMMVSIAEHDDNPDHLLDFISNIYASDFHPEEGANYKPVTDLKLQEQAVKAGVAQDVAKKGSARTYGEWIKAMTTYTTGRKELLNKTGSYKDRFTTPAVTVNGELLDFSQASKYKLNHLQAILQSLGLNQDQVGNADAKSEIGDQGKPKGFHKI